MVATLKSLDERRSQVVSFTYDRDSKGTTDASNPLTLFPARAQNTPTLPVAFTDSTVPVQVLPEPDKRPHLVPVEAPGKNPRKASLLTRVNSGLQTMLVAMCGIAICAYGLDVVVSSDVGRLQEQARRLSEQNTELSAQLLKAISYGELQDSVVGRFALRVPDQVEVVKEVPAPRAVAYRTHRHHLPLMSGY